jgi:hypothetical protein
MQRFLIPAPSVIWFRRVAERVMVVACPNREHGTIGEGLCWSDHLEREINDQLIGKRNRSFLP